ncbi:hypothetical protein MIDIC_280008 [Alphaproteobacteria bacterium]
MTKTWLVTKVPQKFWLSAESTYSKVKAVPAFWCFFHTTPYMPISTSMTLVLFGA